MKGVLYVTALCLALQAQTADRIKDSDKSGPLEVSSLLSHKLFALPDEDGSIRAAQESLATNPNNVALVLKLSKAQAAKRQYREAIVTCTKGLQSAPNNADLYVERGHRELGLREFEAALADLNRAVELDPKQLDAQYHLGMAYYFLRQFGNSASAFGRALALAQTSDSVIDCSNWFYVALRRDGQSAAAAQALKRVTPGMKNKEPHLYFYLRLLHFYQGSLTESQVLPPRPAGPTDVEGELSFDTVNYGVGNWYLYSHDSAHAREFFQRVVTGSAWNSWGFIGSELELARSAQ